MPEITLVCNLEILKKYSNKIDLLIRKVEKSKKELQVFEVDFNIREESQLKSLDFYSYFKSKTKQLYSNPALTEIHLANIFYLLDELCQELYILPQHHEIKDTLKTLNFLYDLLKVKTSNKNIELVIRVRTDHSVSAIAGINDNILLGPDILNVLINRIKEIRFTDELLFNTIQPSEFTPEIVREKIKLLNSISNSAKFQIAHYCVLISKYINSEIEYSLKGANPNAKQLRFIYGLLELFHLEEFIIAPEDQFGKDNLKERNRSIIRVRNLTKRIIDLLGRMDPIPQRDIEKFVSRVLEDFTDEQFSDFSNHEYSYKDKIKEKIRSLSDAYAEKQFRTFIDTDRTYVKASFKLPLEISPGFTSKDIGKSLYDKEGDMNGFEERVINEIANLSNILFWTRNVERKGFRLNGFVNHYPDFIVQTKSGKTIILETKGDDRDNSDSEAKLRLGNAWVLKAGGNFKYFMVFDKRQVDGAHRLDEFLLKVREL